MSSNSPKGAWAKRLPGTNQQSPKRSNPGSPQQPQQGGSQQQQNVGQKWPQAGRQPAQQGVQQKQPQGRQQPQQQPQQGGQQQPQQGGQQQPQQRGRQQQQGSSQTDKKKTKKILANEIVSRPMDLKSKQGKMGQVVNLKANYFKLMSKTDWRLYQYRVDIQPEEKETFVKKCLVRGIQGLSAYIFDGEMLFTSTRLIEPYEKSVKFEEKNYFIKMRLVGEVAPGDYHYIQVFNILIRNCLKQLKLQLVGRNYFDPNNKLIIPEYKLELWPGMITSIRRHEQDILMCTEVAFKVMRLDTMLHIFKKIQAECGGKAREIMLKEVAGKIVLTTYNNRTYKIDDVDFNANPLTTFEMKGGERISYADYYKNQYNLTITDKSQPLLVSRAKARDRRAGQNELIYLIPEFCKTTGLTDKMRMDFNLMKALAEHTRISPSNRIAKLKQFNQKLHGEQQILKDFSDWNFQLGRDLIDIQGRIINAPGIKIGGNKIYPVKNGDWRHAFPENQQICQANLTDWVIIVPRFFAEKLKPFVASVMENACKMRFNMKQPKIRPIADDQYQTYIRDINILTDSSVPQLIMAIVPNNNAMRYNEIKRKLCIDRPIPSQIVLAKNLSQRDRTLMNSVTTKVAIQLNCKIGGYPWSTDIMTVTKDLMVVGFDVCHSKSPTGTDFGAMVASTCPYYFGKYYTAVTHHKAGEELSNSLSLHLGHAFDEFRKVNNRVPQKIIIYRDGVGEGQLEHVYDYEVKQIKRVLAEKYGSMDAVKLAVVVVTKRINTRIFAFDRSEAKNPQPGTIVDNVITDPLKYDFFLVSQNVRQGTVTPTSYNIIEDTTGLSADAIQHISYKLCHMYFNFSGTVRVPAPCQYAHKLAYLVSQSLKSTPHPSLQRILYFL